MDIEIDKIPKNPETDIVIRIDEFNGRKGVTIREFVKSERYTGFTKAGTRIPADKFHLFKQAINMINENDLKEQGVPRSNPDSNAHSHSSTTSKAPAVKKESKTKANQDIEDVEF